MRIFKNKAFLGGICIILAAAIAFVVIPRINANQNATVMVVRPTQEIAAGTTITDSMITAAEVGGLGLPNGIIRESEGVVGKVALETIRPGEYIWGDAIASEEEYNAMVNTQTKGLEDGYCLVTIACSKASVGVAGVLRAGNTVDAYECEENPESGELYAQKVLDSIYVYDVLNSSLVSLTEVDRQAEEIEEGSTTNYDLEPSFVVLRCTDTQASVLIRLEKADALHLTLRRTEG